MLTGRKIRRPRDLSQLSRSCKHLYATTVPVLFEDVSLAVPQTRELFGVLSSLVRFPCAGLKFTKRLAIYNMWDNSSSSYHDNEGSLEDPWMFDSVGRMHDHGRYLDLTAGLNSLVDAVLGKIPPQQVVAFQ